MSVEIEENDMNTGLENNPPARYDVPLTHVVTV